VGPELDRNETFAANEGRHVVKANTAQGHDAWSVKTGAHPWYTSHCSLAPYAIAWDARLHSGPGPAPPTFS